MWHIGRVLAFGGVLAIFAALASPEAAVAQKKKDKKAVDNGYGALPEDYKAIQNQRELVGSIQGVSNTTITLRVDSPRLEPNPNFKPITNPKQAGYNASAAQQYRQLQDAQRLQRNAVQLQRADTRQEYARAMQQYMREMARLQQSMQREAAQAWARAKKDVNYMKNNAKNNSDPFIVVHHYKEFDLEMQDKVTVRKNFLSMEFDDMGNIKVYTEKEKAALRGDDKSKPGYQAKLEEITSGMEAKLTLVAPKKQAAKADDDGVSERPTVSMVLLTKDAPGTGPGPNAPKKKQK